MLHVNISDKCKNQDLKTKDQGSAASKMINKNWVLKRKRRKLSCGRSVPRPSTFFSGFPPFSTFWSASRPAVTGFSGCTADLAAATVAHLSPMSCSMQSSSHGASPNLSNGASTQANILDLVPMKDIREVASQLRSSAMDHDFLKGIPADSSQDAALWMSFMGVQCCSQLLDERNVEIATLKRKLEEVEFLLVDLRKQAAAAEEKSKKELGAARKELQLAIKKVTNAKNELSEVEARAKAKREAAVKAAVKAREQECFELYSNTLESEANYFFGLGRGNTLLSYGEPASSALWSTDIPWPYPDVATPNLREIFHQRPVSLVVTGDKRQSNDGETSVGSTDGEVPPATS